MQEKLSNIDLSILNESQLAPVLDTEGALLVTAGAGSGKTRVLTYRIAHLVADKGIAPYNILAITFTNKAAREMKERLHSMSGDTCNFCDFSAVWMSTFHSMCVSMLRKFGDHIGIGKNFSIYSDVEKKNLLKQILKDRKMETDKATEYSIKISSAKNSCRGDGFDYIADLEEIDSEIAEICKLYDLEKEKLNSLDFDDLIIKTIEMLKESEVAREHYQERFRYIHIDEFQDTNNIQYWLLVKILADKHKNIMAVGDEDQGIYSWRGAMVGNIREFINGFNNIIKQYKLEQNYRSTKKILNLANRIIKNNTERLEKNLWTKNEDGADPVFFEARADSDEADFVINRIESLKRANSHYEYCDFAILLRINALTRSFEERCIQYGIKYKITGGFKFYDRKEIKDILAYLRLTANPQDSEAILRVINFPKRGIGDTAVQQLVNFCKISGQNMFETLTSPHIISELPPNLVKKLQPFATILQLLQKAAVELTVADFTKYLVRLIDLKEVFSADTAENEGRKENIKELISGMEEFVKRNPDSNLGEYLQTVSLYTDSDEELEVAGECVQIATIHSAKGLEFKTVFLCGLEEQIFPISRASDNKAELEEERRLMYVAVTRARERLFLTYSKSRFLHGARRYEIQPSRFLTEVGYVPQKPKLENSFEKNYFNNKHKGLYNASQNNTLSHRTSENSIKSGGFGHLPTKNRTEELSKFTIGARVEHRKFGLGTIATITGEPSNCFAEIDFEYAGRLNLSLNYAPLKLLEEE